MITLCNNKKIIPDNLAQIDHNSLEKLRKSDLVNLSLKLCTQLCAALELLNKNSSSSSKPPSLDNPYEKKTTENSDDSKEAPNEQDELEKFEEVAQSGDSIEEKKEKHKPGKQPGSKGCWRKEKPEANKFEYHYPEQCAVCGKELKGKAFQYFGHYTYELEIEEKEARIIYTLHYYYESDCSCGHENKSYPGEGHISEIEGRKANIKLSENSLAGPLLTAFIASLNRN